MKNIFYRIVTAAYMIALMIVSIQPASKGHGSDIPRQVFNNVIHVPAYGLLTFLLIKSASKFKRIYIVSFFFALAFGVFNEYLQSFVPGRYPSIMDISLNSLGSLIVVIAVRNKTPGENKNNEMRDYKCI